MATVTIRAWTPDEAAEDAYAEPIIAAEAVALPVLVAALRSGGYPAGEASIPAVVAVMRRELPNEAIISGVARIGTTDTTRSFAHWERELAKATARMTQTQVQTALPQLISAPPVLPPGSPIISGTAGEVAAEAGLAEGLAGVGGAAGGGPPGIVAGGSGGGRRAAVDLLDEWITENTRLIVSLRENTRLDIVAEIRAAAERGERPETLAKAIEEAGLPSHLGSDPRKRNTTVRGRAKVIARDQQNKLAGDLAEAQQTSVGIDAYTWRTVRDSRVRSLHSAREGDLFDWGDPPSDGHPGQAVQCRCSAEAVIEF